VNRKNIYFNFVNDDFKQIHMKNMKKFQAREAASSDYFKVLDSKVASNIKEVLDMVEKGQKTLLVEQYKLRGELCHVESASSNRKKLQLIILNCLKKLTQMGLFAADTYKLAIFPTEPFERKNSTMFFKFVKRNDIQK
jgi:predicted house-cleaning noncanonical NTP pyrophosphatase (MazG superfamily)